MSSLHRGVLRGVLIALMLGAVRTAAVAAAPAEFTAEDLARGKKYFTVHCARCHGMQGLGGVGPSLARSTLPQAPDFASLIGVIENGVPGTGMPAFWLVPKKDLRVIAGFVRSLGAVADVPLAGDPARGRELFTRTACNQCHTVGGQGGVMGPDLSDVGNRRGADRLRRMLTEPAAEKIKNPEGFAEFLPVRLSTANGRVVEGLRVNEDGFTIQVRDLDNRLHSFRKSEIKDVTKRFTESIMPSFATVFTAAELDDLVAYLASLKGKK